MIEAKVSLGRSYPPPYQPPRRLNPIAKNRGRRV